MPATPPKTPLCRDPHDVPFLQLAIVGKGDFLVTGNKDILNLPGKIRCPIVTADVFLSSFDRF
jgi:predicted nucleic acid-binding protein